MWTTDNNVVKYWEKYYFGILERLWNQILSGRPEFGFQKAETIQ